MFEGRTMIADRFTVLWHDLYPWPIAEERIWRGIAAYLHQETTQRALDESELERRYPATMRRELHSLGLSHFLTDPTFGNGRYPTDDEAHPAATCLTMPHLCGLYALIASVNTSLAITVAVNTLALLPAYIGASPARLALLFEQVAAGAFGALGLTEFNRGSDLLNCDSIGEPGVLDASGAFVPLDGVATAAVGEPPTHYRLTARKDLINGGGQHELLFVLVRTKDRSAVPAIVSPLAQHGDFSLFAVSREAGISSPRRWHTVPAPGADISSLQLERVVVPAAARIGRDGDGLPLVQQTLAMSRCGVGALAAGLATRALRLTTHYAATRQIYGQPLASLGAIADHLLRMRALELLSTAMSVKATVLINRFGTGAAYYAAITKLVSSSLTEELIAEGRLLHGSRAFLVDEPYHRVVGDAPLFGTFDGTSHVVLAQLQGWLAQLAMPAASARPWLDEVRTSYETPPRRLLAVLRRRVPLLLINPAAYLRELEARAGAVALAPLIAIADALLGLVRHCRTTQMWTEDQGLRFEASRLLAELEVLLAALELTDPDLRQSLALSESVSELHVPRPLVQFAYGWFGGRVASALRVLMLRAGAPSVGQLDDAEATLARECTRGRLAMLGEPAKR
jgi:alkylation response protein AidB-like acyl-CoA dehydrogenase